MISASLEESLRAVSAFTSGPTGFLSPSGALDYFARRATANIARVCDITRATMLDCGCGVGWNVLAYLLSGGRHAVGLDMNPTSLYIARQFSQILSVADRLDLCLGSVTSLPFPGKSMDVVVSIETLEHLNGGGRRALQEINRVAKQVVFTTTPNKFFPVIAHDTRLPFAHWLPAAPRRLYAAALGRVEDDEGNSFLSPWRVARELRDFRLESRFLGFSGFRAYDDFYPHYLPYMGKNVAGVRRLRGAKRTFYRIVDRVFGKQSFFVLPSIAGVFVRK